MKMMKEYESVQARYLWRITVAMHQIVLNSPDATPINSTPYRADPKQRKLEREGMEKMKEAGTVKPAVTKWASHVVYVPNKDSRLRFCVDYCRLNAVTERDSYHFPRTDECIKSLGEAQIFSTFDASSRYLQVKMIETDIEKMAFVTHLGL